MESFDIQLASSNLTIEPLKGGLYRIREAKKKLGVIYAREKNNEISWSTEDNLNRDFVQQIGELITEHNLGKTGLQ